MVALTNSGTYTMHAAKQATLRVTDRYDTPCCEIAS